MTKPADDLLQLNALLDGELNGVEGEWIRKRLAASVRLQEELFQIKCVIETLNLWDQFATPDIRASDNFERKLFNRLRRVVADGNAGVSPRPILAPASRN